MSRPREMQMPRILVQRTPGVSRCVLAVLMTLALLACGDDQSMPPSPAETVQSAESVDSATEGSATRPLSGTSELQTTPPQARKLTPQPVTAITEPLKRPDEDYTRDATESFPTPPERDFYRLARELVPGAGNVEPVVRHNSPTLEVGHRETFKLVDLDSRELYESDFELLLVTPHAYWFFEDGMEVRQEDIERSAQEFEGNIYPSVTAVFGKEWTPGVDGDPHLYVISAQLRGVGGYFSAADEYPKEIRPISNEIEAIYVNATYLPVGTQAFSQVLAHELQHAIHWVHDLSEETWVNEGLSELAVTVAGYPEYSIHEFRRAGPASLTNWPADDIGGAENYGAASLFMHYLTTHYGGREDLRPLLTESADGIPGIDAFLKESGYEARFIDLFRDWAVANLIDEDSGPYGYPDMSINFPVYRNLKIGSTESSDTPQFANEYVRLEQSDEPVSLHFAGDTTVPLLPVDAGKGCWWSNKGDVIDSSLSARLDLRDRSNPSLAYQVWFSIEENWDFAYLEVSVDDGETWTILETPLTSDEDPLQVSFGPGYTGKSHGWQHESVSLEQWAGLEILVRFQYITDAAIHDHGLCLRDMRAYAQDDGPEIVAEWTPSGFAWTDNLVRQRFMVQVVYEGKDASGNRVIQVPLDKTNHGSSTLDPDPNARRVVAVVQPIAPTTRLPSNYALSLQ